MTLPFTSLPSNLLLILTHQAVQNSRKTAEVAYSWETECREPTLGVRSYGQVPRAACHKELGPLVLGLACLQQCPSGNALCLPFLSQRKGSLSQDPGGPGELRGNAYSSEWSEKGYLSLSTPPNHSQIQNLRHSILDMSSVDIYPEGTTLETNSLWTQLSYWPCCSPPLGSRSDYLKNRSHRWGMNRSHRWGMNWVGLRASGRLFLG